MSTVLVTSTGAYSGKSGICIALLDELADRGIAAGYFKPYGTMPVTLDGVATDEDAAYVSKRAHRKLPLDVVCPVVETQALIEATLRGETDDVQERVSAAFDVVKQDADVVIVEGPSSLAQGRALDLHACRLAERLEARVLLVDKPHQIDVPNDVLWAGDCLKGRFMGVLFNAVHASLHEFYSKTVTSYLDGCGIRVFGTIDRDPMLYSVTVEEITEALGGTLLCAEERAGELVEGFMVGAMGQDKALRFFRRLARKAVITGGDRGDVQLAALETDTRCIILTGNLPPSSVVLSRADELGVPMILVSMDTLSAVERMESLFGRVRLHDPAKAARVRELLASAADMDALVASMTSEGSL